MTRLGKKREGYFSVFGKHLGVLALGADVKKEGKMRSRLGIAPCLMRMLGMFDVLYVSFTGCSVAKTGQTISYGRRDDGRL